MLKNPYLEVTPTSLSLARLRRAEFDGIHEHLSAKRGNNSAPAYLAKYHLTASTNADKRIVIDPAVKAVHWGTVASRIDPDPMAWAESAKIVNLLWMAAPSLKGNVEEWLGQPAAPSF